MQDFAQSKGFGAKNQFTFLLRIRDFGNKKSKALKLLDFGFLRAP
jgi:hypothetical protein